jgi:hypothetical protein
VSEYWPAGRCSAVCAAVDGGERGKGRGKYSGKCFVFRLNCVTFAAGKVFEKKVRYYFEQESQKQI